MKLNDKQLLLNSAIVGAKYFAKPFEGEIGGVQFDITTIEVKRECYWYEPVVTLQLKANGKRISKNKAFALLE